MHKPFPQKNNKIIIKLEKIKGRKHSAPVEKVHKDKKKDYIRQTFKNWEDNIGLN